MNYLPLILAVVASIAVGEVLRHVMQRRFERNVLRPAAARFLESTRHTRLIAEDLLSRDPQIAESLEVAILEMQRDEHLFEALVRGDWRELRAAYRRDKS